MDQEHPQEPIEYQISNELDLHTFLPNELGELIPDYIGLCLQKDILRIRIIHGKGIGTIRETVHSLLRRDLRVLRFELASHEEGGWGATVAWLSHTLNKSNDKM
ncbi:MAG: Smr/MutS family protein [Verrucomicrobiota bacterium]|nr:Smr/MutS family protein [Verrucomicrobiota bacterium]MEC9228054.1 Smr/MutS family protein [Verrucomicrobiota bacterium]